MKKVQNNPYLLGAMRLIGRALSGDEQAFRAVQKITNENRDDDDLNMTIKQLEARIDDANAWPDTPPVSISIDYPLAQSALRQLRSYRADWDEPRTCGISRCFHCGTDSVIWGADFSFEDYGREGEGIVHTLTCANCGAEIEYYIEIGEENKEDVQDSDHE